MTTRVPAHHYTMRPSASFISGSLHDLNTAGVAAAAAEIDGISDAVTEDSLDNDDESTVDCIHEYRGGMPMHGGGVDDDDGGMIGNSAMSSGPTYHILTANDVLPVETARARFLQIVVDHFVNEHVVEAASSPDDDYANNEHDKLSKRKPREANYEGDPRFVLPLMYVANLYETLVNDVNMRLASLDGIREKTIGVALEAAGGLYRKLAKKFPRRGQCSFKRRELATSIETRTRFPELVVQEEKRIRFVVVNGLVIVEKPSSLTVEDAEWFKRLTGRHEVAISARDYKFYTPRHKYRRCTAQSVSNIPGLGVQIVLHLWQVLQDSVLLMNHRINNNLRRNIRCNSYHPNLSSSLSIKPIIRPSNKTNMLHPFLICINVHIHQMCLTLPTNINL